MTPEETILAALIEGGAMVADYTANGILTVPIHAEIVRPTAAGSLPFLYWYEADAEDQHHIHARAFDAIAVIHNRDLDVQLQGRRVLYVAPFTEWPDESTDDLNERLSIARARLADPEVRALFDSSVAENRPRTVAALLPSVGALAACIVACLILSGCAIPARDNMAEAQQANAVQMGERYNYCQAQKEAAVERYVANHPALPPAIRAAVLKQHIIIGMGEADVIAAFGDPASRRQAVDAYGIAEQWVYGCNYCLYFLDGRLVSWQTGR